MSTWISLEELISARDQVAKLLAAKIEHREPHPEPEDLPEWRYFRPLTPAALKDELDYRVSQDLQTVEMRVGKGSDTWQESAFPSFGRLRNAYQLTGYELVELQENEIRH